MLNLNRCQLLRSGLVGCFAILLLQVAAAPGADILAVQRQPTGELGIQYGGAAGKYYVLLAGTEVTSVRSPVAVQLGGASPGVFGGIVASGNSRFYRLLEYDSAHPADQDGDGIDDVWELNRPGILDPLSAADAGLDPDRNGLTHLEEYLDATAPGYTFLGGIPNQAGSPTGLNQSTLVIYARPSDDTTTAANLATLRTSEQAEFGNVATFYSESSFNQLSFAFTHAPATGWYTLPRTYDAYMWTPADIAAATTTALVQAATDGQNLVQDFANFFTENLQAAQDDGFNVRNFSQVVVVVIGPFHRGTSYGVANFTLQDRSVTPAASFQAALPVLVVSTQTGWSRTAHEFGHAFGGFADLYGPPSRAAGQWDIMDCTDCGNQTSGWHKDQVARWFGPPRVKVLTRPTGINRVDDVTTLVPYESVSPPGGSVQSLRLDCGGGMHLYVENRQTIAGQVSSQSLPANAVIITDADDSAAVVNASRPPILLFGGPLSSGNVFTDSTYGPLRIAVSGTAPNLTVTTGWGPDPFFDLRISPWTPPPWESPDVWVDSPVNGWDTYEFADAFRNPSVTGNPVRNGDRPRVGRDNRVYARIFNDGNVAANNVQVAFSASTPPGVGDSGNWSLLDRVVIATVPAGGSVIAGPVIWRPSAGSHTCLKATIQRQAGELNANNNEAQENVGDFDTTSSSPWKEVASEFQVTNPTEVYQDVRLEAQGLPPEWSLWVRDRIVRLAPKEVRRVPYRVTPGPVNRFESGFTADVSIAGWLKHRESEVVFGGITASIHLVNKLALNLESNLDNRVPSDMTDRVVLVKTDPAVPGLGMSLDVLDVKADASTMVPASTDGNGEARWQLGDLVRTGALPPFKPGQTYEILVQSYGPSHYQVSTSRVLKFEVGQ